MDSLPNVVDIIANGTFYFCSRVCHIFSLYLPRRLEIAARLWRPAGQSAFHFPMARPLHAGVRRWVYVYILRTGTSEASRQGLRVFCSDASRSAQPSSTQTPCFPLSDAVQTGPRDGGGVVTGNFLEVFFSTAGPAADNDDDDAVSWSLPHPLILRGTSQEQRSQQGGVDPASCVKWRARRSWNQARSNIANKKKPFLFCSMLAAVVFLRSDGISEEHTHRRGYYQRYPA